MSRNNDVSFHGSLGAPHGGHHGGHHGHHGGYRGDRGYAPVYLPYGSSRPAAGKSG
jgi:hypothetical protein